MLFSKSILLLATAALPALAKTDSEEFAAPFSQCRILNGYEMDNTFELNAECYNTPDWNTKTPRAISSMDMNHCLLNRDNHLTPQEGGYAFNSCTGCSLYAEADAVRIDCDESCGSLNLADTPISITEDGLITCYGETSTPIASASEAEGTWI